MISTSRWSDEVPIEDGPGEVLDREDVAEEHFVDTLARGMAEGTISRSRAVSWERLGAPAANSYSPKVVP